ncbi:UDP-glucose 4-epimerase [Actinacidiphila yanglinensis]|uniref:UDP-glucose 4-epimerase n=1 Tax=Actinacidiphila yanglinensis TaxID=310779 RepID=A0A1H6DMA6_9ACTN|nr:UDP-glucose 4-epimerase GalE [Actinacidiphila yanglinensis]SEG86344.1 UDP-glucose 4-epimerase [Actinacidiphila yanglinensis]
MLLITGGAGYIGSHVVRALAAAGEDTVVLDDLSTGDPARLPAGVPLERGSVLDRPLLDRVLGRYAVDGIVHVAGRKQVAESVERPLYYYQENVEGLRTVLDAAVGAGVRRIVFSSSAAVYGPTDADLVTEDLPCAPMSPYGETKLAGEWLLAAAGRAHGLATASLRYFNVAGAATPELADTGVSNIVPMVFRRLGEGLPPRIFGDDYPTPDGTCVRDYVHVEDIASAHVAAARRLARDPEASLVLNIGTGRGVSVAEMVAVIAEETGHTGLTPEIGPRRPGDPARVIASAEAITRELDWRARYDVRQMVGSAWAGWRLHHPA